MRRAGLRVPASTWRASTSSIAICIGRVLRPGTDQLEVWSCQPVARPSARRTAMATDSGVNPTIMTSGPMTRAVTAAVSAAASVVGRQPGEDAR